MHATYMHTEGIVELGSGQVVFASAAGEGRIDLTQYKQMLWRQSKYVGSRGCVQSYSVQPVGRLRCTCALTLH